MPKTSSSPTLVHALMLGWLCSWHSLPPGGPPRWPVPAAPTAQAAAAAETAYLAAGKAVPALPKDDVSGWLPLAPSGLDHFDLGPASEAVRPAAPQLVAALLRANATPGWRLEQRWIEPYNKAQGRLGQRDLDGYARASTSGLIATGLTGVALAALAAPTHADALAAVGALAATARRLQATGGNPRRVVELAQIATLWTDHLFKSLGASSLSAHERAVLAAALGPPAGPDALRDQLVRAREGFWREAAGSRPRNVYTAGGLYSPAAAVYYRGAVDRAIGWILADETKPDDLVKSWHSRTWGCWNDWLQLPWALTVGSATNSLGLFFPIPHILHAEEQAAESAFLLALGHGEGGEHDGSLGLYALAYRWREVNDRLDALRAQLRSI